MWVGGGAFRSVSVVWCRGDIPESIAIWIEYNLRATLPECAKCSGEWEFGV
jgi:hypothetical protein